MQEAANNHEKSFASQNFVYEKFKQPNFLCGSKQDKYLRQILIQQKTKTYVYSASSAWKHCTRD